MFMLSETLFNMKNNIVISSETFSFISLFMVHHNTFLNSPFSETYFLFLYPILRFHFFSIIIIFTFVIIIFVSSIKTYFLESYHDKRFQFVFFVLPMKNRADERSEYFL